MPTRFDHAGHRRVAIGAILLALLSLAPPAGAETSLWSGPPVPGRASPDFPGAVTAAEAEPGASPWSVTEQAKARLVSAAAAVGDAPSLRLGLHFLLAPGWKIYWRSPGAAGLPPTLDWSGSSNLASAQIAWPAPRRFALLGLDTMGYEGEVVLPVDARLETPGRPLALAAKLDYLVCREVCIPYSAKLALALPAGPAAATRFAHLIDRYAAQVPGDGKAAGLALKSMRVTGAASRPLLVVTAASREPFDHPDLFVEGPSGLAFDAPIVALGDGGHEATLSVPIESAAKSFPDLGATPLTLTLVDGARSLEARTTPVTVVEPPNFLLLPAMLALALVGGLILNLMPCVLPVLSLKLLGLVGHGGAERRAIRASFLASAAGVVATFLGFAAILIALKAAGHAVGWGIQFQQPAFLTTLSLLCIFFAANLWGLFEVRLPGFLSDALTQGGEAEGIVGHFLTGAFATLLATPCSAPFLGTALGFALARGPFEIGAIFAALGLGLALPYLLVAVSPGLVARLPRPGRWMIRLKALLGLALAATAAWLLWVLQAETGLAAALAVAATVAAIPAVFWLMRRWPEATRHAGPAAVIACAILAFALPSKLPEPAREGSAALQSEGWRPFERAAIPSLVAQGRIVFVDVTADWCVTCQANKRLVLAREPVASLLAAPRVVRMVADWTRPSDEIADYLASFGRYGIPFNAVYGPGAPQGLALSELLSADAVRAALAKAEQPRISGRAAEGASSAAK